MNKSASQRMTKREVCEYLKKSQRTVEGYMTKGHLDAEYIQAPNGRVAVFDRQAVRKFKKDWDQRWRYEARAERGQAEPADALAITRIPRTVKPLALPAPPLAQPDPARPPLARWLDLDQAAKYSNLPKAFLIRQARAGECDAVNVSGSAKRETWRFRVREGGMIGGS